MIEGTQGAVIFDRITRVRRVAKSSKNGVLDVPHL
jgi:hypothetical protein|tara:strand:- start:540 stop:644 length:105 start_codon:yes stop_codon:yes gene_type:complete